VPVLLRPNREAWAEQLGMDVVIPGPINVLPKISVQSMISIS